MAQSPHSAAAHRGVVPSAWSGMPRSEGAYTRHAHCSALTLASRVHVSTATLQQPSHLVARHVTHGSRAAGLRPPPRALTAAYHRGLPIRSRLCKCWPATSPAASRRSLHRSRCWALLVCCSWCRWQ